MTRSSSDNCQKPEFCWVGGSSGVLWRHLRSLLELLHVGEVLLFETDKAWILERPMLRRTTIVRNQWRDRPVLSGPPAPETVLHMKNCHSFCLYKLVYTIPDTTCLGLDAAEGPPRQKP